MLLACGQAFSVFATQIHYDNLIDYHMNDNKSFCHSAHALIHARTLVGLEATRKVGAEQELGRSLRRTHRRGSSRPTLCRSAMRAKSGARAGCRQRPP